MSAQHIRRSDANVTDHRFRSVVRYANKLRPTLCGAEPTRNDVSRKSALRLVASHRAVGWHPKSPDWLGGICGDCLRVLNAAEPSTAEPSTEARS